MGIMLAICRNKDRLSKLVNTVDRRGADMFKVEAYAKAADVNGEIRHDPAASVRVIVLSLAEGADAPWEMWVLRGGFPHARIVVVLDLDDPERAFDMLRQGAFNAITETADLWAMITQAASGQERPYGMLLNVSRPQPEWGFMSMTYDPRDENHNDYWLAIKPTVLRLQLGLHRIDELSIRARDPELQAQIIEVISKRPVFIAQLSSYTPNTAWEIGVACDQNKTIIPLRRRTSTEPIPAVLKGLTRIEYSSRTELAMRLFFGLGGTMSNLYRCPKSWLASWDNRR